MGLIRLWLPHKYSKPKIVLLKNSQKFLLINSILFLLLFSGCFANSSQPYYPPAPGYIPPVSPVTAEEEKYGHELLSELTQKYKLDYNHPRRASVDIIAAKLTDAIGGNNFPWHINVFADPKVKNAAATKGHHIFVWTGMIDATKNDDELAGVLAHEIGHILAKHTERSEGDTARELIVGIGSFAAGAAASILTNGVMGSDIASQLASKLTKEVGSGLLIYPYSREKELQADEIGLYLMSKAGYDPEAAINFWTNAMNDPDFTASVAFLSTHPPAADRLVRLKAALPTALKIKNGTLISPTFYQNSPKNIPPQSVNINVPNQNIPLPPKPNNTNIPNTDSFDIRK